MAHPRLASRPPQEQNGDSHHAGDWRGPGRDLLPLPVRSRKYQEGPDTAERRPREGGHSPLDSAEVRVQMPRTVGSSSSAQQGPIRTACGGRGHGPGRLGPAGSAGTVLSCEPHPAQPAPWTEQLCPAWGRAAHGRWTMGGGRMRWPPPAAWQVSLCALKPLQAHGSRSGFRGQPGHPLNPQNTWSKPLESV